MEDYEHKEWGYVAGLIIGLTVCWHVPFWVAGWTGYHAELGALAARADDWDGWAAIAFQAGLIIVGGIIVLIAGALSVLTVGAVWLVLVATGKWCWRMIVIVAEVLAEAVTWLARGLISLFLILAGLIWEVVSWPFRTLFELIADFFGWLASKLRARREQRSKLKAAYREEYRDDFHSYRAFLKYWKALQRGEQPPYPKSDPDPDPDPDPDFVNRMRREQLEKARRRQEEERRRKQQNQRKGDGSRGSKKKEQANPNNEKRNPYQAALGLLGLSEPFTKAELGARYKMAMKKAHPDVSGDARLATRLNMARDLILKEQNWK